MAGEQGVHAMKHLLFVPSVIAEGMIVLGCVDSMKDLVFVSVFCVKKE